MPVTQNNPQQATIYQREQYAKGGLGRWHWDLRDRVSLSFLRANDEVIADIGCGEGITLEKIVNEHIGGRVFGVDFLEENIEICRRYGLDVRQGSVYELPIASGSVDFALFSEVIEHLEDHRAAIREIYRILKPGGRISIVFPNDKFVKIVRFATLHFREARYDPGHLKQWTPCEMLHFLKEENFRPIFCRSIPFFFWPLCMHAVVVAEKMD